ncbi:hypothetical protein [Synechococcus sp. MU1643]|uniref:hypothetical protein n=1 Tax=Synechococcus sp. MU1643 TaxID=2508349 RepID=UPI001CF8728B
MKGIGADVYGGDPTQIRIRGLGHAVVLFRWLGWGLGIQHQRQSSKGSTLPLTAEAIRP